MIGGLLKLDIKRTKYYKRENSLKRKP